MTHAHIFLIVQYHLFSFDVKFEQRTYFIELCTKNIYIYIFPTICYIILSSRLIIYFISLELIIILLLSLWLNLFALWSKDDLHTLDVHCCHKSNLQLMTCIIDVNDVTNQSIRCMKQWHFLLKLIRYGAAGVTQQYLRCTFLQSVCCICLTRVILCSKWLNNTRLLLKIAS